MEFTISYPIDNPTITQLFGNSLPVYLKMGMKGHNGIDYRAYHGQPVYATHDGYATYQVDDSGGHGVVIITDKEYEYDGKMTYFKSIYWHLVDPLKDPKFKSPIADKAGFVFVKKGDIIGYANNTGLSTGNHLHFGIKPCARNEDRWTWLNTEQKNGYFGAIDPMPFFEHIKNLKYQLMVTQTTLIGVLKEYIKYLQSKLESKLAR